jgi:hypothetical protein
LKQAAAVLQKTALLETRAYPGRCLLDLLFVQRIRTPVNALFGYDVISGRFLYKGALSHCR